MFKMKTNVFISYFTVIVFSSLHAKPPANCVRCVQSMTCKPPDCFCCRDELSGLNITSSQIPQMVFFTFDDAVTTQISGYYRNLFDSSRKNPNGCPISMTLFISHDNTDYRLVSEFYRKGMEIASHSVTHNTMTGSNFFKEAKNQKENLAKLAKIPINEITGWRSPYLKPTGDLQPDSLKKLGYTYDATLTFSKRSLNEKPPGPFTLDFGYPYECQVKPCPKHKHPGFWEVPIVSLMDYKQKYDCVYVDGCMNAPPNEESAYKFLWDNFNNYYTTTKMPFGINMHPSWFYYPDRLKAMDRFIKKLVSLNDVYVVSANKMLEWLKRPTPLQNLHSFAPWACDGRETKFNKGSHRLAKSNLPPPPASWVPRRSLPPRDRFNTRAFISTSVYTPAPPTIPRRRFTQTPSHTTIPRLFTQNGSTNQRNFTLKQEPFTKEITPYNLEVTQQRIQEEIRKLKNKQNKKSVSIPPKRQNDERRITISPSFGLTAPPRITVTRQQSAPSSVQTIRRHDRRQSTRTPSAIAVPDTALSPITRKGKTQKTKHILTPAALQSQPLKQIKQIETHERRQKPPAFPIKLATPSVPKRLNEVTDKSLIKPTAKTITRHVINPMKKTQSQQTIMAQHAERLRQHHLLELKQQELERLHQKQQKEFLESRERRERQQLQDREAQRRGRQGNDQGNKTRHILYRPDEGPLTQRKTQPETVQVRKHLTQQEHVKVWPPPASMSSVHSGRNSGAFRRRLTQPPSASENIRYPLGRSVRQPSREITALRASRGNIQPRRDRRVLHTSRDRESRGRVSGRNVNRFNEQRTMSSNRNNVDRMIGRVQRPIRVRINDNAPVQTNIPFRYTDSTRNVWNQDSRTRFEPSFNTPRFLRGGSNRRPGFQQVTQRPRGLEDPLLQQQRIQTQHLRRANDTILRLREREERIRRQQISNLRNQQLLNERRLNAFNMQGRPVSLRQQALPPSVGGFPRQSVMHPTIQQQMAWNSFIRHMLGPA